MRRKVTIKNNKIVSSEANLHQQVTDYLRIAYPNVLWRTDFAAGIKMTIGQAVKHKKLQKCKAWPDIFIAEPNFFYSGLFIELKKDHLSLYNKKSGYKNEHVREQAKILEQLNEAGYLAVFAIGFDGAKMKIDDYLSNIK